MCIHIGHSIHRMKVRKTANIRKQYNQLLTWPQDSTWESNKNTINITNNTKRSALSQQVTTRQQWTDARAKTWETQDTKDINDPQKKYCLRKMSRNIFLEGLNWFHGASLTLSSDGIKTHRCLVCMRDLLNLKKFYRRNITYYHVRKTECCLQEQMVENSLVARAVLFARTNGGQYFGSTCSLPNKNNNWANAWAFQQCDMCNQQNLRSACAYAQSDQSLW